MLAGIYYGSQYGGSTTSILMRIPGEAASVMTCIDGYAMAQKGRAGAALCIAAVGSFIAGTLSVIALTVIAPPLGAFALRFGPPEYTALLILGLIFLAYMSSTSLVRTLLMATLGPPARLHRHRRDDRPLPLQRSTSRNWAMASASCRLRSGCSGSAKSCRRRAAMPPPASISPRLARTAAEPRGVAAVGDADRARHACWASLSASCRARPTSSRAFSPTRWRNASPSIPRSSAKARSQASRDRNRPTTPPRPARSCRCCRSACRPGRSPRC